jgi:hypothetical protein
VLAQLDMCGLQRSVYTYSILIKALTNDTDGRGKSREQSQRRRRRKPPKGHSTSQLKGKRNARLALQFFMEMTQEKGIPPNNSVTSCLIHCLCAAGLSHEAKTFFFILIGLERARAVSPVDQSLRQMKTNAMTPPPPAPSLIAMQTLFNDSSTRVDESDMDDESVKVVPVPAESMPAESGTISSSPAPLLSPFLSRSPLHNQRKCVSPQPSMPSPLRHEYHYPFDLSSDHFKQHLEVSIPQTGVDREGYSSAVSTPSAWGESPAHSAASRTHHSPASLSPFLSPPSMLSPFIQQAYSYNPPNGTASASISTRSETEPGGRGEDGVVGKRKVLETQKTTTSLSLSPDQVESSVAGSAMFTQDIPTVNIEPAKGMAADFHVKRGRGLRHEREGE